mmetsp:Transcript_26277/g.61090  ORF Transcript_26277/g.61090 Transcript_26277/m.61090 type:complete len:221 (+) Transcript_26277:223-885(+)
MAPNDYEDDDDEVEDEDEDEEEEEEEEEDDEEEDDEEEEEAEEAPRRKRRAAKPKKDPNKPKRNMSAFFLYSQALRPKVKEENPEVAFGEIAKILSQRYKSLPDKEKKKWEKKAEKDKKRYQEEMKNYEPPDDEEPTGKRSKKQKKDPNKPKRNMSAYFLYSVSIRPEVRKEHPDASFGQIAKIISQKFKDLSDKERQPWVQKANEDKKRYEREMREYNS